LIENGSVRKYSSAIVAEIWLFTIILFLVVITALPLLRDVLYHFVGIHGGIWVSTPSNFSSYHVIFGFILIVLGLIHLAIHGGNKKSELLMKRPRHDFKAFLHSLIYLVGFAKREEQGGGERYSSRQRVVYLALVYTIGLSAISGVSLFLNSGENEFNSIFTATHIISAIVITLVLLFHLAINIRKHDSVALKASYTSGKLPLWYVKKNHKIWYLDILKHEKTIAKKSIKSSVSKRKTKDPVAKAITKLYEMDGIVLDADVAEELAKNFKKNNESKDIERFVEISKTI
jgi:cytochrome b subunit of formate dehydrogenase